MGQLTRRCDQLVVDLLRRTVSADHVRFGGRERRVLIEARPSRPNAELGAAFLCADLGISVEPRPDHAQYLAHWLAVMKADKRAIFTAASKASQAAAFLGEAAPS